MKTDLFQSCGHCLVFQIFWHIECNTFTASSFRSWNSSTGIPSPQLALFVVIFLRPTLPRHIQIHIHIHYFTVWSVFLTRQRQRYKYILVAYSKYQQETYTKPVERMNDWFLKDGKRFGEKSSGIRELENVDIFFSKCVPFLYPKGKYSVPLVSC